MLEILAITFAATTAYALGFLHGYLNREKEKNREER
jgi:hypothetical protein